MVSPLSGATGSGNTSPTLPRVKIGYRELGFESTIHRSITGCPPRSKWPDRTCTGQSGPRVTAAEPTPPDASPDIEYGSFTEHGPWVVEPDSLKWRRDVPRLRAQVRDSLPELIRYRRVPPGGRMLVTLRDLGLPLAVWAVRERGTEASVAGLSRRLRIAAERLGPTYIKLGQIISSG